MFLSWKATGTALIPKKQKSEKPAEQLTLGLSAEKIEKTVREMKIPIFISLR